MGRAYQKVLAKKSLVPWGAEAEGKVMEGRPGRAAGKEKAKAGGEFLRGGGACQADLRKPDLYALNASAPKF